VSGFLIRPCPREIPHDLNVTPPARRAAARSRGPPEVKLAGLLPYSLGTIQKAYGELVKVGLIERSRGRGSFVASLQRQMSEPWHCRFLADDGEVAYVQDFHIPRSRRRLLFDSQIRM